MRYSLLLFAALFFAACGNDKNGNSPGDDSLSAKDSLKKALREDLPPPSEIKQFNWFYSAFVQAATIGDDSLFNHFIDPEHGLWIIHSEGAMPSFTHVMKISEYKTANGKMLLPFDRESMITAPVDEALPKVNCDSPGFYSKKGCFTQQQNTFMEEKIWRYAGLTADDEKDVETQAASITRTVVNTANYRYYFSLVNGSWYLTFLDIRKPCSA